MQSGGGGGRASPRRCLNFSPARPAGRRALGLVGRATAQAPAPGQARLPPDDLSRPAAIVFETSPPRVAFECSCCSSLLFGTARPKQQAPDQPVRLQVSKRRARRQGRAAGGQYERWDIKSPAAPYQSKAAATATATTTRTSMLSLVLAPLRRRESSRSEPGLWMVRG